MDPLSRARVAKVMNAADLKFVDDFLTLPENDVPYYLLNFSNDEVRDVFLLLLKAFQAAFQNYAQFPQFSQADLVWLQRLTTMTMPHAGHLVDRLSQEAYVLLMHRALTALGTP